MQMSFLDCTIRFWECKKFHPKFMMPSRVAFRKRTTSFTCGRQGCGGGAKLFESRRVLTRSTLLRILTSNIIATICFACVEYWNTNIQTTFILRFFEIRGADISERSLKVQKIEEKLLFSRFMKQKKKKFTRPGNFSRLSCLLYSSFSWETSWTLWLSYNTHGKNQEYRPWM
jgi:hypothetical protein